jgi:VCBS repeat-containing protein
MRNARLMKGYLAFMKDHREEEIIEIGEPMRKILYFIVVMALLVSGCAQAVQAPAPVTTDSMPAPALPTATAEPIATPTPIPPVEANPTESASTPASPPQVSQNDACGNPYYPVVNDASWDYSISTGEQATHSMLVGEEKVFTITIQSKDSTFTIEGQCTDDGIILMDVPGVSSTYSGEDGGSTLTTQNVEGVTLPNDVQQGDDWSQKITVTGASSDGEVTLSATIDTTYTALGYEQVTVPAGTFNALKVEQTGTLTMNGSSGFDTHGFIWYAQGVGTVKSGLDDTYTAELTTYSIP